MFNQPHNYTTHSYGLTICKKFFAYTQPTLHPSHTHMLTPSHIDTLTSGSTLDITGGSVTSWVSVVCTGPMEDMLGRRGVVGDACTERSNTATARRSYKEK